MRSAREAADELATFASEIKDAGPRRDEATSVCIDDAIEQFVTEYLRDEKGREDETLRGYRTIHRRWFSPEIGQRLVRSVDAATIDRIFGKMRRAGLSRSTLNQAKSLYGPFFRWAKRRGLITRNPMAEFELPTSKHVSRERTPPEAWELSILLNEAVAVAPEVAPLLVLGEVTGMRRGELVGLRRSRIDWGQERISVDAAITGTRLKPTKTRKERSLHVDEATLAMLRRHCDEVDRRAQELGAALVADPFVFTLSPDGSEPIPPHYVTKRVAVIKERLGIEDKEPQTIAREDEALRLFRQERQPARAGKRGPHSKGGLTFSEIGDRLGRSERWAALAVAAAERREQSGSRGLKLAFDGSILALRKFTSSELLDAGFNLSMVAQRQGHGPQVLTKHYARSRASADRRAAEHLGRVVHAQNEWTT